MLPRRLVLSVFGVCICGAVALCSMNLPLQGSFQAEADPVANTGYLFDTPVMNGLGGSLILDKEYSYSLVAKASSQVEESLMNNETNWSWLVVVHGADGISPEDITMTSSILNGTTPMMGEIKWNAENETTLVGLGNEVPEAVKYHPDASAPDASMVDLNATMEGSLIFHANGNYSITATVVSLNDSKVTALSPSLTVGGAAPPLVESLENVTAISFAPISSNASPPCQTGAPCPSSTSLVKYSNFFTNLTVRGYWSLECSGQSISLSPSGMMVGQPVGGLNCNQSNQVSTLTAGKAYYFWVDASTQQAYIDFLKANGFNHSNVWEKGCLNQNLPLADWRLMVSSPGITSSDVIMNAGYGWPSQANAMAWKPFTQGSGNISACLESDPSYYSMSVGHWAMGQWTDHDIVTESFPALTPGAIQFQKPGTYTLSFFLVDGKSGSLVSQMINTTVVVEGVSEVANCAKPWPSTIEIFDAPESMIPGQTYTFQARMMVENFDANCSSSPWYFATNTPITWTMTGASAQTSPTDGNGVSAIQFTAPSSGEVTVTASWSGNEEFQAANVSVTIPVT